LRREKVAKGENIRMADFMISLSAS
jgi:hypothetical protein